MEFALFKFCPLGGPYPLSPCANTETEPTKVCAFACVACFVPCEAMPAHPFEVVGAMHVRCKRRAEEEEEGVRRRAEAKAAEGKKNGKA